MAGNAGCLGLHGLCTTYLQALGGGVGVEGHVLCLEGCRLVAVLEEDTAEGRCQDALANIAARTGQHDR